MQFPDDTQRSLILCLVADQIAALSERAKSPKLAGPAWAWERGEAKAGISVHRVIECKVSHGEFINEPDWDAIRGLSGERSLRLMARGADAEWFGRADEAAALFAESRVYHILTTVIEEAVPGICRERCLLCGFKFLLSDRYLCDNCANAELTKTAKAMGLVKRGRPA